MNSVIATAGDRPNLHTSNNSGSDRGADDLPDAGQVLTEARLRYS